MRSSIFLAVPFAAMALGQVTDTASVVTAMTSNPPSLSSSVLVAANMTSTTASGTGTAVSGNLTGTTTTSTGNDQSGTSSTTGAPTTTSTSAAAGMMQPFFGLGLVGVIVAALF